MAATSHALLLKSPERDELEPQHATGLLLGRYLKPRIGHSRVGFAMAPFEPDQLQPVGPIDASGTAYVERARASSPVRQQRPGTSRR